MTDTKLSNHEEFKKKADIKLTNALSEYASKVVTRFDELEFPASITVFTETNDQNFHTCSLRRKDLNSLVISAVIKNINHLANDLDFMLALTRAISDN